MFQFATRMSTFIEQHTSHTAIFAKGPRFPSKDPSKKKVTHPQVYSMSSWLRGHQGIQICVNINIYIYIQPHRPVPYIFGTSGLVT